ncbi:MAG: hypothetical protein IPG58_16615 [Acidobacteria bacterium]|nr:hypothetical protein [Acidobacteriota bacterium]
MADAGLYEWQSEEPLQFGNVYWQRRPIDTAQSTRWKVTVRILRHGIDIPAFDLSGFFIIGARGVGERTDLANNYTSGLTNTLRYFTDNVEFQKSKDFKV